MDSSLTSPGLITNHHGLITDQSLTDSFRVVTSDPLVLLLAGKMFKKFKMYKFVVSGYELSSASGPGAN